MFWLSLLRPHMKNLKCESNITVFTILVQKHYAAAMGTTNIVKSLQKVYYIPCPRIRQFGPIRHSFSIPMATFQGGSTIDLFVTSPPTMNESVEWPKIFFKIVFKSLLSRHAIGGHGHMEAYKLANLLLLSIIFLVA